MPVVLTNRRIVFIILAVIPLCRQCVKKMEQFLFTSLYLAYNMQIIAIANKINKR